MSNANAGLCHNACLIEKTSTAFLHYIIVQQIAAAAFPFGVAGMGIDHATYFHAHSPFESVVLFGVAVVSEFDGGFEVNGREFGLLIVIRVLHVGELQHGGQFFDADLPLGEQDVIGADAGTEGHAQAGVVLEGEIEHQVGVDRLGESVRLQGIGQVGPLGIAQLQQKMVVGATAQVEFGLALGFLGGFLGHSGDGDQQEGGEEDSLQVHKGVKLPANRLRKG